MKRCSFLTAIESHISSHRISCFQCFDPRQSNAFTRVYEHNEEDKTDHKRLCLHVLCKTADKGQSRQLVHSCPHSSLLNNTSVSCLYWKAVEWDFFIRCRYEVMRQLSHYVLSLTQSSNAIGDLQYMQGKCLPKLGEKWRPTVRSSSVARFSKQSALLSIQNSSLSTFWIQFRCNIWQRKWC